MSTNNTYQHVSNESVYVEFDPAGSNFPAGVTNVQDALASLNIQAVEGINTATETVEGIAKLATLDDVMNGVSNNTIVTPYTLGKRLEHPEATEVILGLVKLSTKALAEGGTDNATVITPLKLTQVFDYRNSTETRLGTIKISTNAAALAGTDDTTAMTPLKTQQAIAVATSAIPTYDSATESVRGLVQLATVAQARAGVIRDGFSISPYTFKNTVATQSDRGVVKLGTQSEVNNNGADAVVTGATLNQRGASGSMRGVVKLTTQAGVAPEGDIGSGALAWNADVVHIRGGQTIHGSLNLDTLTGNTISSRGQMYINSNQLVASQRFANERVPVGTIIMWAGDAALPGWTLCHGGTISGSTFPDYKNVVGYRFGGGGDACGVPDMRGLFVRGAGTGGWITGHRGHDGYGKDNLGVGCDGSHIGGVQQQQISYHQHAGGGLGESDRNGPFGSSYGAGYYGTRGKTDWDNHVFFSNNGFEIGGARDALGTLNRPGLIGYETRPWNMSLNYMIKVHY